MGKRKSAIWYAAVFLSVLFIFVGVVKAGIVIARNKHIKKIDINQQILGITKELNAKLPIMLDKDTRFDSATVDGVQMIFKYTLINYSSDELDKEVTRRNLFNLVKEKQCSEKEVLKNLSQGVVYKYIHYSSDNVEISNTTIDEKFCKK